MQMRFFSSVEGRAVPRFGTDTHIGCKRTKSGFVWDTTKVVAIPVDEIGRRRRDYQNAVRRGDLLERTEDEWSGYIAALEAAQASASEEQPEEAPTTKSGGGRRRKS